jgi:hypothetical protein
VSDETTPDETSLPGLSRRNLMKAGAIVGGTIWVTPVVESFLTKAAAESPPPGGTPGDKE